MPTLDWMRLTVLSSHLDNHFLAFTSICRLHEIFFAWCSHRNGLFLLKCQCFNDHVSRSCTTKHSYQLFYFHVNQNVWQRKKRPQVRGKRRVSSVRPVEVRGRDTAAGRSSSSYWLHWLANGGKSCLLNTFYSTQYLYHILLFIRKHSFGGLCHCPENFRNYLVIFTKITINVSSQKLVICIWLLPIIINITNMQPDQ